MVNTFLDLIRETGPKTGDTRMRKLAAIISDGLLRW
jgi:hypothetical protein